jgi:hypothetical protein
LDYVALNRVALAGKYVVALYLKLDCFRLSRFCLCGPEATHTTLGDGGVFVEFGKVRRGVRVAILGAVREWPVAGL